MKRALVLSLICVVGLGLSSFALGSLTGTWNSLVCLNPLQTSFDLAIDLTSTITVKYTIGNWAFTSTSGLSGAGWDTQTFGAVGNFGLVSVLSSVITFDPSAATFTDWVTKATLDLVLLTFTADFTLETNDAALALTIETQVDPLAGKIVINLGNDTAGCDFDFVDVTIGLDWTFCDCAAIAAEIFFSCDNGFEYVKFCTTGIAVPNIAWLTVDACLQFGDPVTDDLSYKAITITPNLVVGTFDCISLGFEFEDAGPATYPDDTWDFGGFSVVGISIECEFEGVTFTGASSFDNALDYWEVYTLSVSEEACCEGLFTFDLALSFDRDSDVLFDLGLIEVDASVNVTESFAFLLELDINVDSGEFTRWCLGFNVTW